MKVLIVIPAYNEQENIERVVDDLIQNYPQYDYLVVNDGSKDRTAAICREKGYHFLDLPVNLGLAGAFQAGMRYADRMDYDMAIQFDGDGQHDPQYIEAMAAKMEEEALDVVIFPLSGQKEAFESADDGKSDDSAGHSNYYGCYHQRPHIGHANV